MIAVGQHLGGYTVQRRIGGGQMGEVFLAQHRRIARRAAIKALIPELSAKEAVIERFFKQARNTSVVTHPGIVAILDCDVQDGQAYVVMEFLHGESLGTYLKRNGALASDMAFLLGLMAHVAGAVGAAHDAGILHRGLKPENIYLHLGPPPATAVSAKVLDFGVAQLSRDDGGPSKTTTGLMLGAPAYLSPEQCRGVGRTDERSDIYALGCVFYEALCGRTPFVSKSPVELITAQVTETPKPPIKLVPDLLPKLNALILKMLAKTPDERPRAMSEVVESLRVCARAMGIDFEGPLEPVVAVERPDYIYAVTPASAPLVASEVPAPAKAALLPPLAPLPSVSVLPDPVPAPVELPARESPPPSIAPPHRASPAPSVLPPVLSVPPVDAASLAKRMAAAVPSAADLPFAARSSEPLPRTKILEDDEPPADEPVKPPVARPPVAKAAVAKPAVFDPIAQLNAMAGETIALPDLARAAKPVARPREDFSTPRGMAGGTQVLPPGGVLLPRPIAKAPEDRADEDEDEHEDQNDDEGSAASRGPMRTAVVAASPRHASGSAVAALWQKRPWLILGLTAAVVLVSLVLAATLPFGRKSSHQRNPKVKVTEAKTTEPTDVDDRAAAVTPSPPAAETDSPPSAARAAPETAMPPPLRARAPSPSPERPPFVEARTPEPAAEEANRKRPPAKALARPEKKPTAARPNALDAITDL